MWKTILLSFFIYSSTFSYFTVSGLYKKLNLQDKMTYQVFKNGMKGISKIKNHGKKYRFLTIIDFTKPSNKPRFSVIDLKEEKLCFYTYVSHGKNSGKLYATNFSNTPNSFQSSLGFYVTAPKPYIGDFGYSVRLKGMEDEFNSNAFRRDIVIHGAEYASKKYIDQVGFLGRTLGCPAIPNELSKPIIDTITNNTLIFVASNDERYLDESNIIN